MPDLSYVLFVLFSLIFNDFQTFSWFFMVFAGFHGFGWWCVRLRIMVVASGHNPAACRQAISGLQPGVA